MATTEGVKFINSRKTFVPLENNPEVFSLLCKNLGLAATLTFHDVLSTSDLELLSFIPRPINALILLCGQSIFKAARSAVEPTIPEYQGSGPQEPVLWVKQTIGHACGLMALLHCAFNLDHEEYVTTGTEFDALLNQAIHLRPKERARLLYDSKFLEEAHMDAAREGNSDVPSAEDDNAFHFVAFVKKDDGNVWELNGGMNGPFLRGKLEPEEDLLGQKGLDITVKDFLDIAAVGEGEIGVSLVAVALGLDGHSGA